MSYAIGPHSRNGRTWKEAPLACQGNYCFSRRGGAGYALRNLGQYSTIITWEDNHAMQMDDKEDRNRCAGRRIRPHRLRTLEYTRRRRVADGGRPKSKRYQELG
jgi:hypothetical protein